MKIGIPRALLYYKYSQLWETFFEELGVDYLVSPGTNKDILRKGMTYAIDEACLSSKVYLGHVEWLLDKCDYILVPHISGFGSAGTVCTKFKALYDVTANTFRDRDIKLLSYSIESNKAGVEMAAFLKMGKLLGKRKSHSIYAYLMAKQAQKSLQVMALQEQEYLFYEKKIKILIAAHPYNFYDSNIGKPVTGYLRELGVVPIPACIVPGNKAAAKSAEISETLPWAFSRELVGAIALYKEKVDGIILMSTLPCGPDSLVNETVIRRVKEKPVLYLIIDGQQGRAGLETRLESFVDIIRFKKDGCLWQ